MTGKVRMNAFLVLLLAALFVGLLARTLRPFPVWTLRQRCAGTARRHSVGVRPTLTSIGIVIVAGTIIGTILRRPAAHSFCPPC